MWRLVSCCTFAAALIAPQQRRTRARLRAESRYWSYDGVDVHYAIEQSTKPSDAVVVFGPGFGAGAFQFSDVCRHVAAALQLNFGQSRVRRKTNLVTHQIYSVRCV